MTQKQRIRYLFRKNNPISDIARIMGIKRDIVDKEIDLYIHDAKGSGKTYQVRRRKAVSLFGKTSALHTEEMDYGQPWQEITYWDLSFPEKQIANRDPNPELIANQYNTIRP